MVHGFVSTPAEDTNVRVRLPAACAGALATTAVTESTAMENTCEFIAMPLRLNRRVILKSRIIAQAATWEISPKN
jgi:hypothetical protein